MVSFKTIVYIVLGIIVLSAALIPTERQGDTHEQRELRNASNHNAQQDVDKPFSNKIQACQAARFGLINPNDPNWLKIKQQLNKNPLNDTSLELPEVTESLMLARRVIEVNCPLAPLLTSSIDEKLENTANRKLVCNAATAGLVNPNDKIWQEVRKRFYLQFLGTSDDLAIQVIKANCVFKR